MDYRTLIIACTINSVEFLQLEQPIKLFKTQPLVHKIQIAYLTVGRLSHNISIKFNILELYICMIYSTWRDDSAGGHVPHD